MPQCVNFKKDRNEKELGNFQSYDLKPAFLIIDEFPSFRASMLEQRELVPEAEIVMGALKQDYLKRSSSWLLCDYRNSECKS
jgi:hypothetical protein